VLHGRPVYSATADELVRQIAKLADDKTKRDLEDLLMSKYNEYRNPNVAELERYLTELRDRLLSDARARGFEPQSGK
jgi:hypothetical protein